MQYKNPDIYSSYRENDLGRTFYDLVLEHKPKKIIEFGTLYGYSTVAMAMALDELGEGHVWANDLFEDYEFRHSTMEETQKNIDTYGVTKYITLQRNDFEEWLKNPEPFDLLHVDISNKGDTIERLYEAVKDQIAHGAIVIFEGGTEERDQVEWVTKYNCKKIYGSGIPYKVLNPNFTSLSQLIIPE
jgi:predicted O-methyltransferase YrrM